MAKLPLHPGGLGKIVRPSQEWGGAPVGGSLRSHSGPVTDSGPWLCVAVESSPHSGQE